MFKDKKLRNTFWLSILAVLLTTILIEFVANFSYPRTFGMVTILILSSIAVFINMFTFIYFIQNWNNWHQILFKILGLIISLTGLLAGIYMTSIYFIALTAIMFN